MLGPCRNPLMASRNSLCKAACLGSRNQHSQGLRRQRRLEASVTPNLAPMPPPDPVQRNALDLSIQIQETGLIQPNTIEQNITFTLRIYRPGPTTANWSQSSSLLCCVIT